FRDHLAEEDAIIARLQPFQAVCVMRERTPLPRNVLAALPNLKLVVSTGSRNAAIDEAACQELDIELRHTGYVTSGAPEHTWALLLGVARHLAPESAGLRANSPAWQTTVGVDLEGKTLGIVGLGHIGRKIAQYAHTFSMRVVAWSPNLTAEKATEAGAQLVRKDELFRQADFVTIHLVLSARSRGSVDAAALALMKPTAYLVNTSRGPLVDEAALVNALATRRIAGAALDVFDQEPLPAHHPFRTLPNVLATPHLGYVTEATYQVFYQDTVTALLDWLAQRAH
ncbi:MAG: D-2-hydroxyacid dehydrogenase family protein, partial [Hymenobacter sp.]